MPKLLDEQEARYTYEAPRQFVLPSRAPVVIDGPCPCGWSSGMSLSWRCGGPKCKPIPAPPDTAGNGALAAAQAVYVPPEGEQATVVAQQAAGRIAGDGAAVAMAAAREDRAQLDATARNLALLRPVIEKQAAQAAQANAATSAATIAAGIKDDLAKDESSAPSAAPETTPSKRFALIELE